MVELQPYDPAWAVEFERERARLEHALPGLVLVVEHIGSTAVPGLLAKPVIDLAARGAPGIDVFSLGEHLAPLGYVQHRAGPKNHGVYVRTADARRTHILHVFAHDDWNACNQRLVRDRLLTDPEARRRYAARKREIAGFEDGRDYTAAKGALVQELLDAERASRGLPPVPAWDK